MSLRPILAVAALVLVAGCTATPAASTSDTATPAASTSNTRADDTVLVIYEVVGDAKHAKIAALTPSGDTETLDGAIFTPPLKAPSWAKYKGPGLRYRFHRGDQVQLIAASVGPHGTYAGTKGSVTCRIRAAKTIVDEETAGPDDLPATCQGNVPLHDGVPLTVP